MENKYLYEKGEMIYVYDKNGTKMTYEIKEGKTKLKEIETKYKGKIIYNWEEEKLVKIENGEETLYITYDEENYIKEISLSSNLKKVRIEYENNLIKIIIEKEEKENEIEIKFKDEKTIYSIENKINKEILILDINEKEEIYNFNRYGIVNRIENKKSETNYDYNIKENSAEIRLTGYSKEKEQKENIIKNGYLEEIDEENKASGYTYSNFNETDVIIKNEEGKNILRLNKNEFDETSLIEPNYKTKIMYQEILKEGIAGEYYIYSVKAKSNVTINQTFRIFIKFVYETEKTEYIYHKFYKNEENWQVGKIQIKTKDNYKKIIIGIEYDGKEALIEYFKLNNNKNKIYINYDKTGNITEEIGNNEIRYKNMYDEKNLLRYKYEDGNIYKYSYDYLDRLVLINDIKGNRLKIKYDDKNRIIEKEISNSKGQIKEINEYDDIENSVITSINDYKIKKTYNKYNQLKKIEENGVIIEYEYNKKELLEKEIKTINNKQYIKEYTYDNLDRLKTIKEDKIEYEIEYDESKGFIKEIKLNGKRIKKIEYEEINNYRKDLIKEEILGLNETYGYEYNIDDNLEKVKIEGTYKTKYTYDEIENIKEKEDLILKEKIEYKYDINNNIEGILNNKDIRIDYSYNKNNEIEKVAYEIGQEKRSVEYLKDKIRNTKVGKILEQIENNGEDIVYVKLGPNGINGLKLIDKTVNINNQEGVLEYKKITDFIDYKLESTNNYQENIIVNNTIINKKKWEEIFKENKTIYVLIKPENKYSNTNIISLGKTYEEKDVRKYEIKSHIYLTEEGKVGYKGKENLEIEEKLELDKWNLIGIKLKKEGNKNFLEIMTNETISKKYEIKEEIEEINHLLIGYQTEEKEKLEMPFKISEIVVGIYDYNVEELRKIKERIETEEKEEKIEGVIYYDKEQYKGYDVVTLNNTIESTNKIKPIKLNTGNKEEIYEKDKDNIPKLRLGSKKANITYKLPLGIEGTILLRFKIENIKERSRIIKIDEYEIIVNEENKLCIKKEEIKEICNIKEEWNNLLIRYNNEKLEIYLNEEQNKIELENEFKEKEEKTIIIGEEKEGIVKGLIEMLAYKGEYEEKVEEKIKNEGIIIIYEIKDELGNLKEKRYKSKGNIIKKEYEIDEYGRIKKEKFKEERNYEYDIEGKLIKELGKEEIKYEYDKLKRLIRRTRDIKNVEIYSYDEIGNIINKNIVREGKIVENVKYEYDELNPMKLIKMTNLVTGKTKEITYSSKNELRPDIIKEDEESKLLTWQGNALIKIGNKIKYEYNTSGIRIKKETPNEISTYKVEGNRIIKMNKVTSKEDVILEFIYDSNSILVGVNTKEDNYFYVRDIMGNIEGIIDSKGEYIVKYRYNGWGEIESKEVIKDLIVSRHNPFMYKGYYYDEETGLFYCNSRYYSPELCRWISPDSIEYLDPSSINGLNLYVYANNNPIGIAYSSFSVGCGWSDGMIDSTRGTIGNIVGIGSVGGGSKVSGFGSLGGSSFGGINWPKANSVAMTHYTTSLFENQFISWMLGNISYTTTVQLNSAETFYSFSNIGNDGYSVGFGVNLGNWYGSSFYVGSDYGFGTSWQVTPWITGGYGWSLENGISISGGIIIGDTSHEITVSVGNGALLGYAVCGWVATLPAPGARAVAATAACIIFIVDLFN